jgi:hypothetical protein
MATAAQITANRANSKLSSGPKTAAGKRRSSINNLSYGLFANDIREHFSEEDRIRYDDFIKLQVTSLDPRDPQEDWLARKIAETMFMLDRAHDLNIHILCEPFNVEGAHRIAYASHEPLPNIALYKNRMRNDYERYSTLLRNKQAVRKEKEEKEMCKADTIAEACAMTQTKFEPAKIGFQFSQKDYFKQFLLERVMTSAFTVLNEGIADEKVKVAFNRRLAQLTDLIASA